MLSHSDIVQVQSLNIGRARFLNPEAERPVKSAIDKRPVGEHRLLLTRTGLQGDQQANLKVHGGPQKALYVYPSEHYRPWSHELQQILAPGAFGENVTSLGAVEDEVQIGDIFVWGNAVVRVVSCRQPCSKLNLYRRVPDMIERMKVNGRCGWYCEVIESGTVGIYAPMMLLGREEGAPTIAERFREKFPLP